MTRPKQEEWERARRAGERLEEQFLFHPLVSLIDVGIDPSGDRSPGEKRIVLRVHLRRPPNKNDKNPIDLPAEVDGIPVRIMIADYKAE